MLHSSLRVTYLIISSYLVFIYYIYVCSLQNWENRLHEVYIRKCGRVTQSLRWVATKIIELPTYEGLPNLVESITKFDEKVSAPQRLLEFEEALKATPARWWETHKKID